MGSVAKEYVLVDRVQSTCAAIVFFPGFGFRRGQSGRIFVIKQWFGQSNYASAFNKPESSQEFKNPFKVLIKQSAAKANQRQSTRTNETLKSKSMGQMRMCAECVPNASECIRMPGPHNLQRDVSLQCSCHGFQLQCLGHPTHSDIGSCYGLGIGIPKRPEVFLTLLVACIAWEIQSISKWKWKCIKDWSECRC